MPADETIELRLPTRAVIHVYASTEHPGDWIISADVDAIDVQTGQPGHFSTKMRWHNGPPPRAEIAQTMINMIAHEICEQLGLDPHARLSLPMPETPVVRLTDDEVAQLHDRVGLHGDG